MKRKSIVALAVIILIGYVGTGIHYIVSKEHKVQLQEVKLKSTSSDLKQLQLKYDVLNSDLDKELQQKNADADRLKKLESDKQELEKQKQDLETQLQAKLQRQDAEKQRIANAANNAKNVATGTARASAAAPSGGKYDWMRAAGIPEADWPAVDSIVSRESGWNPNAVNKSSGACGLGQQLPCGKWAGAWNDPVAALRAQHGYVNARYGGYWQAVAFWNANHWY